jgi:F420-0:gamma-glutamyl ligase-like protein
LPLTAKPIRTRYWRPGDDFLGIISDSVQGLCEDGDIVVISEKALSVGMGCVVDEARFRPRLLAKVLVRFWMRLVWGYLLGRVCHFGRKTIRRLRRFPIPEGESHKEVTLQYAGFWQSLLHYSEGGIDVTNLPYAFAALPIGNTAEVAAMVFQRIRATCGAEAVVLITDTDKTYSWKRIHITPRPRAAEGIWSLGLLAVIIGRCFHWSAQATPLAMCGRPLSIERALAVADIADRARGFGAGRTVWDMATKFHVGYADVTWEMLDRVKHFPIVVVRSVEREAASRPIA